jgi:hypothetical protein
MKVKDLPQLFFWKAYKNFLDERPQGLTHRRKNKQLK